MEFLMEVILVTILLVLLYEKPEFLVRFSNSTLGKICSVVLIVGVSQYHGLSAVILSTLIILVLRNTWLEGNTNITVIDEEIKLNSKKNKKHLQPPKQPQNQCPNPPLLILNKKNAAI